MNIVINNRPLQGNYSNAQGFFSDYIFKIIEAHQEHAYFLITDKIAGTSNPVNGSTTIAIAPVSKNILVLKFWYGFKLPSLLKKYAASIFININSIASLNTVTPQCLLVADIAMLEGLSFSKKDIKLYLNKATIIIAFSQFAKNKISKDYFIDEQKIIVFYMAGDNGYLPISETEKEACKEKYTAEKEYFLFIGELNIANNLIHLLKAFSFFKKRQKSNMQLVIATKTVLPNNPFIKSLASYKYKDDVKLLFDLPQQALATITASAYTFVYAPTENNFYLPVVQAMQSGVPVIVSNTILMNEICGDAALFTDPAVFEHIADKMMLLFKDENKRNELIEKGKQQATQFTIEKSSQVLWQNITKCAGITG